MEAIEPTVTEKDDGNGCDPHLRMNHPAYGVITLSNPRGHSTTLFGSDIGHASTMCIEIRAAELKRDLSNDWIHGGDLIVEVEMSHAQFAEFITSPGKGDGTPCTITRRPDPEAKLIQVPPIKNVETKHETFQREIHDSAKKRIESAAAATKELIDLIESGKLPKAELRRIASNINHHINALPGSMSYVVKSAEDALEAATSSAKIEVEAYIGAAAQRMGLKSIQQLAEIERKHALDALSAEGQANGDYDNDAPCLHVYSRSMLQDYPRKCIKCGQPEPERLTDDGKAV